MQLFIPKAELADLLWSVPPPTVQEASAAYQVTRVEHLAELTNAIKEQMKAYAGATFHILPAGSPLFPSLPAQYTALVLPPNANATDEYLLTALHRARLIKDTDEIAAIRQANAISSRAHEVVMRVLGQGVRGLITQGKGAGVNRPLLPGEWLIEKEAEAEALFVASCRREGCVHEHCLGAAEKLMHAQCHSSGVPTDCRRFDSRIHAALLLQRPGVRMGSCSTPRSREREPSGT